MSMNDSTSVTYFVLAGLGISDEFQVILFISILLLYIVTLVANLSILIITISDVSLHTPMYFFLGNLAVLDICYSSVVVPRLLADLISQKKMISFYGCMLQVQFFHFLGSTEVIFFAAMSYDRYVAIAHPLRYTTIMSYKVCFYLVASSWIIGFFHAWLHTIMTLDVSLNFKLLARVTGTLATTTLLLTILSYIFISKYLLKIKTSQGRKRAISTCRTHFTVVTLQYGTAIYTYAQPSTKDSIDRDRTAAIIFTAITPALNPIKYTLRNKDMKKALKKLFKCSP